MGEWPEKLFWEKKRKNGFKKTINLQCLLMVSSIYACLHAVSMKHVHFPIYWPPHMNIFPSAAISENSQGSIESCASSKFGFDFPISSLQTVPNLSASRSGLSPALQLLDEELAGPCLLCTK